jgi:hypothetical protein
MLVVVAAFAAAVPILARQEEPTPQTVEVLKFAMAENFTRFVIEPDMVSKALELLAQTGFSNTEVHQLPHDIFNYYYVSTK